MTTERPSDTAVLIARSILLAEATPSLRVLLPSEAGPLTRQLLDAAGSSRWLELCLRFRGTRALLFAAERRLLPGIVLHYIVRKNLIADWVAMALQQGCAQLVILGAGLDTLAWRQARAASTPCFELDHPATQAIKRRAFHQQARVPLLIPADLTQDSPAEKLRNEPSFSPARPTVFVAEGLLMYLTPLRVAHLMSELAQFSAPGSCLIFTFVEARPDQPLAFQNARPAVNRWLRAKQEPFRWGLGRSDVTTFGIQHGWQLSRLSSVEELRERYLSPHGLSRAPLAAGESIASLNKLPP